MLRVSLLALCALFLLSALATQVCLKGTAEMMLTVDAPSSTFCNSTGCAIAYEISFDSADTTSKAWPLKVTLADGKLLTDHFPELSTVSFQCTSSGDIILNTPIATNMEHMRLIWTYSGSPTFDCDYMLQNIDWTSDFSMFQALLSFSGTSISAFDAVFASQSAGSYSLAAQVVQCPQEEPQSSSSGSYTGSGHSVSRLGACHYPLKVWLTEKKRALEWNSVRDMRICGVSYDEIAFGNGDSRTLPAGFERLAQQVVAATLNAAQYEVTQSDAAKEVPVLATAVRIVSHHINCDSSNSFAQETGDLSMWNDQLYLCVDAQQIVEATNTTHCERQRKSYLAWAISMTVVAGVLILGIIAYIFYIYYTHHYQSQQYMNMAAGMPTALTGNQVELSSAMSMTERQQQGYSIGSFATPGSGTSFLTQPLG